MRFKNISGEAIPPFAVVAVTDAATVGGVRSFAGGNKPGANTAPWGINGPVSIPADGDGEAHSPCMFQWCAYDSGTGTPSPGDEWGPVEGNWKLSAKGFGFRISKVDSANGRVYGSAPVLSGNRVATMTQKIKNGQTKKAQLKDGYQSGSAGPEIDVYNRLYDEIASGTTLYVSDIMGRWEIIAIDSEDDDESSDDSDESSGDSSDDSSGDSSNDSDGSGDSGDSDGSDGSLPSGGSSGDSVSNPSIDSSGGSGPSGDSSGQSSNDGSNDGSGKDSAIVSADWTPGGYVALYVTESPEVRFEDHLVVFVDRKEMVVPLDPRFVKVCEPGTLEATSAQSDIPVPVGAIVEDGIVRIRMGAGFSSQRAARVVVRLSGIRRGFLGVRFPAKNRRQFQANERWLRREGAGS